MNFVYKKGRTNFDQECEKMGANPVIFNVMLKNIKQANPTANVELIKKALLSNYPFCESHRLTLNVIIILFDLIDYRGGKNV